MIILITGGSGSGKSAFAEKRLLDLPGEKRTYLATMQIFEGDREGQERVERHRRLRQGKGFETLEWSHNLRGLFSRKPEGSSLAESYLFGANVLLEDLPNLLANEMFSGGGKETVHGGSLASQVAEDLFFLESVCECLVVVTGELTMDGARFDGEMEEYLSALEGVTAALAKRAEEFWEVVVGIPILQKSNSSRRENQFLQPDIVSGE